MRIIGIDVGEKRTGVAISDENGEYAFPKTVLETPSEVTREIITLAHGAEVKTIVLGESKDFGGRSNPIMKKIDILRDALKAEGFTVVYEPEFFSSIEAERFQGKTEHSDASAAAIILQRYLDKKK